MKRNLRIRTGCFGLLALGSVTWTSAAVPERPNLTTIIKEYSEAQRDLVQERRDLAETLRDKTVEERRQAIEEYQTANADRLALHRARGEQVRELLAAARPPLDRPERALPEGMTKVNRPELPTPVQDLMAAFQATRNALLQERLDLLADLREATDEDRARALGELRQQNAEAAAQQKALAQELRDAVQDLREERRGK
jgi:hypothetical protein